MDVFKKHKLKVTITQNTPTKHGREFDLVLRNSKKVIVGKLSSTPCRPKSYSSIVSGRLVPSFLPCKERGCTPQC